MKNRAIIVILASSMLAWNLAARAQSVPAAAPAGRNSASLASGTTINAELEQAVDAKKNKLGDAVTARSSEALKLNGKVIPKGAKLLGHVTEAKARGKGDSESLLGFAFDELVLADGEEIQVNFSIQAVAASEAESASYLDYAQPLAGPGPAASSRNSGTMGGGPMGGNVTSTPAPAAGAAGSTQSSASDPRGTAGALNGSGQFNPNSRGVFGLTGLSMTTSASSATHDSLITSTSKNVHLDSGTRLLLVTQGSTQSEAGKN